MRRTKHDVVTEFRQGEIVRAACRVFARTGFEAATVDEVAAEAGVAKGTLYLYFKSKLEIYLTALKGELEKLDSVTHKQMALEPTAAGKLRAFVETRLAYLDEHSDFFKIYQFELGHMFLHPSQVHSDFSAYYRRQSDFLREIMEQGVRNNEFHCEYPNAMAFLIYDTVRGVAMRRLLGLSELSLSEDTRMAINFIWSGMGVR